MIFFKKTFFVIAILSITTLFACSQGKPAVNVGSAVNYEFETSSRPGGNAFYAMNSSSGQLYYMTDFGGQGGEWQKYGSPITPKGGTDPLLLKTASISGGTIFYAMNARTGQVYLMVDYGATAGQWKQMGGMIRQNALNMLQFDVIHRGSSHTFYAFDGYKKQAYYMNIGVEGDVNDGKWQKYGEWKQ